MTFKPSNSQGPFVPINQNFSEDDKQRIIQMTSRDRDMARSINDREIAIYSSQETPTGQQWDNPANAQQKISGFRKVFTFGALGTGTQLLIPIGVTGITRYTLICGTALTTTVSGNGFINVPLPYVNFAAITTCIQLDILTPNIEVFVGSTSFNLSSGIVILEYLKN